jgi:hypothetical protein
MKAFRIRPGGFKEIQKKLFFIVHPFILLAGGVGITPANRKTPTAIRTCCMAKRALKGLKPF